MVMTDVDCTEIPVFVDEEVDHIDSMKTCGEKDRIGDIAMELILIGYKGEVADFELVRL